MTENYLIKNVNIVNDYAQYKASVYIENGRIKEIMPQGSPLSFYEYRSKVINGEGKYLLPGVIDDQVHFREPGLTQKAEIQTETSAAVLGGVTSFMEMPNTIPQAVTNEILEDKYRIAEQKSWANYSFYLGATNDNIDEIIKVDKERVCGIKVFMGSSTGNLLVDNDEALNNIFKRSPVIITAHCEDDAIIHQNLEKAKEEFGENIPFSQHPKIRSKEACHKSSAKAKMLASKHNARLHILHISTEKELELLESNENPAEKKITAEACIHHLWFNNNDYETMGSWIKWNPAIKNENDRIALLQALLDDRIDIVATDHAPHTMQEKDNNYLHAPSGGPMIQHSLLVMLEFYQRGLLSMEKIVQKMAHNPAKLFNIRRRGYIKEGYWADLVLVDVNKNTPVTKEALKYKCGWSPLEGYEFKSAISHTFVNGKMVVENGKLNGSPAGIRMIFDR